LEMLEHRAHGHARTQRDFRNLRQREGLFQQCTGRGHNPAPRMFCAQIPTVYSGFGGTHGVGGGDCECQYGHGQTSLHWNQARLRKWHLPRCGVGQPSPRTFLDGDEPAERVSAPLDPFSARRYRRQRISHDPKAVARFRCFWCTDWVWPYQGTTPAKMVQAGRDDQRERSMTDEVHAVLWDFGGVILSSPFEAFAEYEREAGLPENFIRGLNARNPDTN